MSEVAGTHEECRAAEQQEADTSLAWIFNTFTLAAVDKTGDSGIQDEAVETG